MITQLLVAQKRTNRITAHFEILHVLDMEKYLIQYSSSIPIMCSLKLLMISVQYGAI